ncbi:hypothetical protein E5L14_07235 [Helicobacter pylori]|nr:hypothetical protein E5L14_07235 [Helicobacter pylori]
MDYKKIDLSNTNYPNKEQLKAFETAFNAFLETNPQENENHQNDAFNDLLKGVFKYKVKPTKKIDSAILNDNDKVEVIIEFKALKNPNEFIKKGDLNVKAFHESLFYYLIERKNGNNNLKHLILATIKELYIIDANEFEVFNKDKEIENAFKNCHDRKGNDTRTEAFYDVCQKRLNELDRSLKYHHISLKKENLALIYQALSPNFLLKIPKYSDANTLNKDFYKELLYILGLEEQNDKGKILIKPSRTQNSLSGALKEKYKNLDDEEVMALLIAWNNRILFLRLLESLLISFEHFEKPFLTTENFKDFNALNTLFFEVLAKKNSERLSEIKEDKILFRDLLEKSLQGNINTIHLKDIQDQKETNGRIYKGANCHRYFLDTQYLFAKDNQITQQIFEKNYYQNIIVTQNITGTSDPYRIHANLIEVKNQEMLFLHTCNLSYCKEQEHAKFLVGLLNSRLLDWLFRKTSTNNHVNLYELETLPIPQITKSNKPTADKIIALVDKILQAKEKDPKANTQRLEKEIDALVYQLYNLTDEEIKIIENGQ